MNIELDLVVQLKNYPHPQAVAKRATQIEEIGFDRITVGETTGWNIIPPMTLAADQTTELGISNNVVSPYGRSPAMLAQTALTMHDISEGRFRLGLGASSPAITEQWHGNNFNRPLRRVRETIEIIHSIYADGNPTYQGDIFDIDGISYNRNLPENPPPIDVSALGPKATELAGRFGNGWTPQMFTKAGLQKRLKDLERGANIAGKSLDDLRVAPIVSGIASQDRESAFEKARSTIAFMLGAYGPYYGNSVARQGYSEVVENIRSAWQNRNTDAMADALPDKVLSDLAPVGTPEEVQKWVEDYTEIEGVNAIRLRFVNNMTECEKRLTMETVADQLSG